MSMGRKALAVIAVAATLFMSGCATEVAVEDPPEKYENQIARIISDELTEARDLIVVVKPAKLSNSELLDDKGVNFELYTSIVALTEKQLGDYSPKELSDFVVSNRAGDYTVALNMLVVNSEEYETVYFSSPTEELETRVGELFGEVNADGGVVVKDPGWEILRQADTIAEIQREYSGAPSAATVWRIVGFVVGGIVALGFIIWGLVAWVDGKPARIRNRNIRKANRKAAREEKRAKAAAEKIARTRQASSAPVTDPIEEHMENLALAAQAAKTQDEELAKGLQLVLSRFRELLESITLMETPTVRREILFVEYEDRFEKLNLLVGPKYYGDILMNPEHWREPEKKLAAIVQATERTAEQILENIIQLKEGSEFDFELTIESLLGFKIIDPNKLIN